MSGAISAEHCKWLADRGLSPELLADFGVASTGSWLKVPFIVRGQVVNHKARKAPEKRHMMEPGKPLTLCNHDALLTDHDKPVVITEGEWDMFAALQSLAPVRVVSVPNGAPNEATENLWEAQRYEWVHRHQAELDKVDQFILATDNDGPGRLLAADLAGLFGPERCRFITYPHGCKDLNDVLLIGGRDAVADVLNAAKPYPVKGLYRFSDYPPEAPVMKQESNLPGVAGNWPLVMKTLSIITGYSGIGKTSFLCWVIADLLRQGVTIAIASFETDVYVLRRKIKATLMGVAYDHPKVDEDHVTYDGMIERQVLIISQHCGDEETEMDLPYFLDTARVAVVRDGARLVILDPWNEIEHKHERGELEHDYTGRALRMIKRWMRQMNVAFWLVAHPKKPPETRDGDQPKAPGLYHVSGSAHWANKADYGITIHRPNKAECRTDFIVGKVRMGLPGREGLNYLSFNPNNSGYDTEF